jgi:NADH-quinone oxidoreductase subunit N
MPLAPPLLPLAADIVLSITLLAVVTADALIARPLSLRMPFALPGLAMGGALLTLILLLASPAEGHTYAAYAVTPMGRWWRLAFIVLLLGVQGLTGLERRGKPVQDTSFGMREGAYQALLLASTLGMFILVSSREWLTFFLGLELATLPLLALTAFRPRQLPSVEAGVKLVVSAGLAMAFSVFGISLLYGSTGSLAFASFAQAVHPSAVGPAETYRLLGAFFLLGALFFKVAAVPFQMWAPDVYQGAPLPVTAYFAVVSKAAGVAALALIFFGPLAPALKPLQPSWIGLALATQLIGNLGALRLTHGQGEGLADFSRFVAYSSIAQAGFFLLAFFTPARMGQEALIFNVFAYGLSTLALFFFWQEAQSIHAVPTGQTSPNRIGMDSLRGLGRRRPDLALGMALALFSLAGIPPLVGFMGKFLLFSGLAQSKHYVVLALALANTVIALYYYARWALIAYADKADSNQSTDAPFESADTCEKTRVFAFWIGIAFMLALLALGVLPLLLNAVRAIPR